MNLQINLNELESALSSLLQELRNQKGDVIEIAPVDYYWTVNEKELFDPYNGPKNLTLGQLTDDLSEIKKIADHKADPVSYDLVKVSAVLTAIGYKTVW